MKEFTAIYKILAYLNKHKGDPNFDVSEIAAGKLKLGYEEWEQIMIELQVNGYIRGLVVTQTLSDRFPHIVEPIRPVITLKGMEYLQENSMMNKAEKALAKAGEVVPIVKNFI